MKENIDSNEAIYIEIGKRIRAVRGGMSQEEFASRIGVVRQVLSRWERGQAPVSLPHLLRIAKEANRPLAYFLIQKWEPPTRWAPHIADIASQLSVGAIAWYKEGQARGRWVMGEAKSWKVMPLEFLESASIAITIQGSELEDLGIMDGDLLLVRMQSHAAPGDIVLMEDDGEVWIERKEAMETPGGGVAVGKVVKLVRSM